MAYYIDLSKISLDDYKTKLKNAYLPPSRMILKEKIEERINCLKYYGFSNLQDVFNSLKKKNKFEELSSKDCLSVEYLTILLREIKSMHPKPNNIKDFPIISDDTKNKLSKNGYSNTLKIYDTFKSINARKLFAKQFNINKNEILTLTKITDLSRIKWAGVTFICMLMELGIDTVKKVSEIDYEELHTAINKINKEKTLYKGSIGLNDIKIFIEASKDIPLDIEYE